VFVSVESEPEPPPGIASGGFVIYTYPWSDRTVDSCAGVGDYW
jgi:hypothetical protein